MKTKRLPTLLFFVALAAPAAGQLFPFDKTADAIPVGDTFSIAEISMHLDRFGTDSIWLETYIDIIENRPAPGGWAYRTQCTETWFLGKRKVAGKFHQLLGTRARVTLLFYWDSCYLEIEMEMLPDGSASTSAKAFGNWPPVSGGKT